jgi:hypothetical protein
VRRFIAAFAFAFAGKKSREFRFRRAKKAAMNRRTPNLPSECGVAKRKSRFFSVTALGQLLR